jgi:hypothetical protein
MNEDDVLDNQDEVQDEPFISASEAKEYLKKAQAGELSQDDLDKLKELGIEPPDIKPEEADYSEFYKALNVEEEVFAKASKWAVENLKPSEVEAINQKLLEGTAEDKIAAGQEVIARFNKRITGAPMLNVNRRTSPDYDNQGTFNDYTDVLQARGIYDGTKEDYERLDPLTGDPTARQQFITKLGNTISKKGSLAMTGRELQEFYPGLRRG